MPVMQIDLTLTFTTPPSVGAGGASSTIADKVVTRNAFDQFIIPASQVKGKLRHACEQLLRGRDVPICRPPRPDEMCPQFAEIGPDWPQVGGLPCCLLCQLFGSPGSPSRLRFFDLVADQFEQLPDETLRTMVSLNRRRRMAEEKRLFLIETAPNLAGLRFAKAPAITGSIGDRRHLHLLLAGLKALFAWGGGTSRGLGWSTAECRATLDGEAVEFNQEEIRQLWPSSK